MSTTMLRIKSLKKVAEATAEDEKLLTLSTLMMYGWPSAKHKFPSTLDLETIGLIVMNCPFKME
jgi:hypothetical protein